MIPKLYDSSCTNMIAALLDALSCDVEEERHGAYTLVLRYPRVGVNVDEIGIDKIIRATHDNTGDLQDYRICEIDKNIDDVITVYANHISYDLNKKVTKAFAVQSADPNAAASAIWSNCLNDASDFTFTSDISTVADYAVSAPSTIRSLLGGQEGSLIDTYGGELEFDNRDIYLHASRGEDRGAVIRYGVNMTAFNATEDGADIITGYAPYWLGEDGTLVVPTTGYVGSSNDRLKPLDLSSYFAEAPTVAELTAVATAYYDRNARTTDKITVKASFLPLESTNEYANTADIPIYLCDTITVAHDGYGITQSAKVIKMRWDVLMDKAVEIEVGEASSSLDSTIAEMASSSNAASIDLLQKSVPTITRQCATFSDQSVVTGTHTTLGSFTLDAGYQYLIEVFCRWSANANGVRILYANTSSASSSTVGYNLQATDYAGAISGFFTTNRAVFTVKATSSTTLYLHAYQNSGSTLTCQSRYTTIKMKYIGVS